MRKAILVGGLVGCVMVAGLVTGAAQQGNPGQSEIQRGFDIAPVPLNLTGKNRSLVGLGSYLVNGPGDCLGCHTGPTPPPPSTPGVFVPGGNPFLGQPEVINAARYLGGGNFFGPFESRNLTPDRNGHPAGLTWEQFEEAIRLGTDFKALPPHVPNNPGLLQVMPWPAHRNATDRDLKAIYEYLSAIPCIEGGPGQPDPLVDPRC